MLVLNPDHLKATRDPLLPSAGEPRRYAAIVRFVLVALAAAAAVSIGYAVTQYLANLWPVWSVFVALAAFVYLASLATIVVDGLRWHIPLGVIWGAGFALSLPWRSGVEAFSLAGIVALSCILAYATFRSATQSYAMLHTFSVIRQYASVLATGIVIALIVLYGAAVSRGSALLPQGILANAADTAASFVPKILPNMQQTNSSSVSVRDLALAAARAQLQDDPRYKALGPEQQAEVLRTAADQSANAFSKQLGVHTSPDATVGSVAQTAIGSILNRFQDQYGWYFTIAWLLGAFFVARSAAFLLTIIIAVLAWLTVTAAISLGILKVEAMPSVREQLTL